MSNDRNVRFEVSFLVRAREQGERVPDEVLAHHLGAFLRSVLGSSSFWDGQRGRVSLALGRLSHVEVERIEEWESGSRKEDNDVRIKATIRASVDSGH